MKKQSEPVRKLQLLGKFGRIMILLAAAIYLLCLMTSVSLSGPMVMLPQEIFSESFPETDTEIFISMLLGDSPISFVTLGAVIASVFTILHSYLIPAFALVLLYLVFNSFAAGKVLTGKIAWSVFLLGFCCLSFGIDFDYRYMKTEPVEDKANQTKAYSVRTSSVTKFEPLYLVGGIFILSLGLAMQYGAKIEEENKLTV